jgi:hypothetical protein
LKPSGSHDDLLEGLSALWSCAEACTACADACLGEEEIHRVVRCIRTCRDCGDICEATAKLLTRQTQSEPALVRAQLQACVIACQVCGAECEKHAEHMAHCRICAEACHRCERICKEIILHS